MLARTGLAVIICLALGGQADAKPSGKAAKSKTSKTSKKKPRHRFSRDKIREESMTIWPKFAEFDTRLGKVGVPELDRLLAEHPPLGGPVPDDVGPDLDHRGTLRLAVESRDRGVSAVAMTGGDDAPLERLKRVAEPLLGSPYRTGGESTQGFDCSGFVRTVLRAFGQNLTGRSSPAYYAQGEPVGKDRLQTGDLLFFADHQRSIGHVGIYLAEGKFVHASVQRGVIVSGLDENYYKSKYKGARRHEDFASALRSPEHQVR